MILPFNSKEEAVERSRQEAEKQRCDMVNTKYYWGWSDDDNENYYLIIPKGDEGLLTKKEIARLED